MRYPGGKSRIGRRISEYLESIRESGQSYYEPFLGMASVFSKMISPRYGSDIDCGIINMWKWGIQGWVPPKSVSREEHEAAKNLPEGHPLKMFIGTQCSFGGKYFASYATGKIRGKEFNFAKNGSDTLVKTAAKMKDAVLECKPYWKVNPENAILYLDPPYINHAAVHNNSLMNYPKFFVWASYLAIKNEVIVSGYENAAYPSNFIVIARFGSRIGMEGEKVKDVTEALFRVIPPSKKQLQEMTGEISKMDIPSME